MIRIETTNLLIRNHLESDWKSLYDYLSLPEIYRFEPGEPITEEEAKKMARERSKEDVFLAVVHKQMNLMVGHLYFHLCEPERFMTWELGFIFHPAYQNRGYCTEASSAILQYAFDKLHAHKVIAFCNPENIPSWKVLEKIGLEREGFFKKKAFFRTDKAGHPLWHDCYAYGLLNSQVSGKS